MDLAMDSVKTILHSEKFLRAAPDRLENLIRRIQRENSDAEATAFSPMLAGKTARRENHKLNRIEVEAKEKNAA